MAMTYIEALSYLESLNTFGINLGLMRIEKLLDLMGHPERKYKTVHVTGTNGKGSVTASLAAVCRAAGIRTGMYISPHLVDYTERAVIDGRQVSREHFAAAVDYVKQNVSSMVAAGCEHPTQFEVLTAAAFYIFAEEHVEYAIIEVGLGGLLDSTNVIVPELAIITNVTLEHMDRCGNTVQKIAQHKAGIIKQGVPVVTAASPEALEVIWNRAAELQAPLYIVGRDFSSSFVRFIPPASQEISFRTKESGDEGTFCLHLLGRHQQENAAAAIMAAKILSKREPRLTAAAVRQGLSQVVWPARFELLPRRPQTVLDGAHNPAGVNVLRETLDAVFPDREITFVLGILRDKDIDDMVSALVRPCDRVIAVSPLSERAAAPEEIAARVKAAYLDCAADISEALAKAERLQPDVLCVTGSLYLVGAARRLIMDADREPAG